MPARIASSVSPQVVRRLLLPGFFTLLGVAILVGLGFWQIERMGPSTGSWPASRRN